VSQAQVFILIVTQCYLTGDDMEKFVEPKLTKRIAKAVASSLLLPEINSDFTQMIEVHYPRRLEPKYLIRFGDRFTKSLRRIEDSRTDLERYFDFMESSEEIGDEREDKAYDHFSRLLLALGATEREITSAISELKERDIRERANIWKLFFDIPLVIRAVDEVVSHAIKGSLNLSNPVDWKKVSTGLTFVSFAWPVLLLSAVFDTALGLAGMAFGGALAASGSKHLLEGLSS